MPWYAWCIGPIEAYLAFYWCNPVRVYKQGIIGSLIPDWLQLTLCMTQPDRPCGAITPERIARENAEIDRLTAHIKPRDLELPDHSWIEFGTYGITGWHKSKDSQWHSVFTYEDIR